MGIRDDSWRVSCHLFSRCRYHFSDGGGGGGGGGVGDGG